MTTMAMAMTTATTMATALTMATATGMAITMATASTHHGHGFDSTTIAVDWRRGHGDGQGLAMAK